jgi:hypothetical protein
LQAYFKKDCLAESFGTYFCWRQQGQRGNGKSHVESGSELERLKPTSWRDKSIESAGKNIPRLVQNARMECTNNGPAKLFFQCVGAVWNITMTLLDQG